MAKTSRTLSSKAVKPKTSIKAAKANSDSKTAKPKPSSKAGKPALRSRTAPKATPKTGPKTAPKSAFAKRSAKAAAAPPAKRVAVKPASPKSAAKKAAVAHFKKPQQKPQTASEKSEVQAAIKPAMRPALAEAGSGLAGDMVAQVVVGIREKKGYDIAVLNLTGIASRVTDYFVICTGGTDRRTQAIADSVEETLRKQLGERPWRTEGAQRGEWILMDYVNVVVHIMQPQSREFYMLEELWGDAQIQRYAN